MVARYGSSLRTGQHHNPPHAQQTGLALGKDLAAAAAHVAAAAVIEPLGRPPGGFEARDEACHYLALLNCSEIGVA